MSSRKPEVAFGKLRTEQIGGVSRLQSSRIFSEGECVRMSIEARRAEPRTWFLGGGRQPLPHQQESLGSAVSSPSGVWRRAPAEIGNYLSTS